MKSYRAHHRKQHPYRRRLLTIALMMLVIVVGGVVLVRHIYYQNLRPASTDQQTRIVTIAKGSSVKQISRQLESAGIVRQSWAFEWYVHSEELGDRLKAGTYAFTPSESTPQIIATLTKGKVTTKLVTILPGHRIDQVRADLINDGFSVASVDAALRPDQYRDLPVMSYVPAGTTTLEGLLYPDSFQRIESTDPTAIIRESLKEMNLHLTTEIQAAFARHNLTTYQGLVLTSIVEQEVSKPDDRQQVAQVFLSRLAQGMSLGSDVTARYGAIAAGKAPSLSYDSPYNTLKHTGLPPTPISTVSTGALMAVASPASTNWLYFVTGDDGVTHFSQTLQQHQANTDQYCHKLCGQ